MLVGKSADARKQFRNLRAAATATIVVSHGPKNAANFPGGAGGIVGVGVTNFSGAERPGWSARVWRLDDGLPDNRVTGIVQTPDNYLWLATHSGLARFDGVRFQSIGLPIPSRRTRPLSNLIDTFAVGDDGLATSHRFLSSR